MHFPCLVCLKLKERRNQNNTDRPRFMPACDVSLWAFRPFQTSWMKSVYTIWEHTWIHTSAYAEDVSGLGGPTSNVVWAIQISMHPQYHTCTPVLVIGSPKTHNYVRYGQNLCRCAVITMPGLGLCIYVFAVCLQRYIKGQWHKRKVPASLQLGPRGWQYILLCMFV